MEVDGAESVNSTDCGKFANLKAFVNVAREFEATHSESAVNLMTRYLGLIASSCDLSIFSPGRSEVCAFFSSLWRVMCDARGPHWAGIAVLARASIEPSARHALTHTYKFMPILARLLSDCLSNEKKIKILTIMQDITYGIKISWQESYLSGLMKHLTDLITQPMVETQQRAIGHKSLTVLVNLCYGNLPAIYALMRTVDTKDFVIHLVSLKDGGYGGVEVCRLLLCLSGATRGSGSIRQPDVHSYLCCTMNTFHKAIAEKDPNQLLHAYTFINDLCEDNNLSGYVLTYPNFAPVLKDALEELENFCNKMSTEDTAEHEAISACLSNALKFITALMNLDLYTLRSLHCAVVALCMRASRVCLPDALQLFAAVVAHYRDEGQLPPELVAALSDGLPGLLAPPALEPGKAGLQWLQAVSALCESNETQQRVLQEVTPDSFEDTLYSVLQYTMQNGPVGVDQAQQAAVVGCRTALALAPRDAVWRAALARLLAHHQVRKMLCAALSGGSATRRKQVLQLVKHHCFPPDQMSEVFGDRCPASDTSASERTATPRDTGDGDAAWAPALPPRHRQAVDSLVNALNEKLREDKISDIATSSVMELYGYKITCLEQRLHSHSVALQGATEHMASLQHALAMLQAANTAQQDVLYTTQMHNEKHKKTIDQLHKQMEDAENTVRGFRAKLAAERLDKENQRDQLQKEYQAEMAKAENEMKARERAAEERLRAADSEHKALQKQLEQMTNKSTELAGVLIKFEERVKERNKKLEEAAASETALRREIDNRETTIKQLEKTVLERENRLYQLTTQLEEMKRVQEMVAKLMSKSASTGVSG